MVRDRTGTHKFNYILLKFDSSVMSQTLLTASDWAGSVLKGDSLWESLGTLH